MSITKKNVTNENWFRNLFINEAKPALERHSGTGGEEGFIDVTELPTENIEQDKVYRLIEEAAGDKPTGWIVFTDEMFAQLQQMGLTEQSVSYADFLALQGVTDEYIYYEDDKSSLNEINIVWSTNEHYVWYVCQDSTTGKYLEPVCFFMGGNDANPYISSVFTFSNMLFGVSADTENYPEVITDPSEATVKGTVYLLVDKVTNITYGIPNEADDKKIYEHTSASGWVELGSGNSTVE